MDNRFSGLIVTAAIAAVAVHDSAARAAEPGAVSRGDQCAGEPVRVAESA